MLRLGKLFFTGLAALLFAMPVMADDNEVSASSDTSTNPITGTKKNTVASKSKHLNRDGTTTTKEHKKVEKTKTDGTKTTTEETESSTN